VELAHEKLTPIASEISGTTGHGTRPVAIARIPAATTARCAGTSASLDRAGAKASLGRSGRSSRT
jgi:hypothetical protein